MTIKQKILTLTIALTVVCAAAVFIGSVILFNANLNEAAEDKISFSMRLLEEELDSLKSLSRMVALEMAENENLAKSISARDIDETFKLTTAMQKIFGIDFCTVLDPEGNVMLRTHEPENNTGNLSSQDNIKAAIAGDILTVIEEGTAVRLSARTGTPIRDENNNIVGIVSVGYRFDMPDFVDSVKHLTGCEVTVFLEDERISTTVTDESGERAVGTKADPKISGAVLAGQTFIGKARIMGRNAHTEYAPLYGGSDNAIIGMIFVGQYTDEDIKKITNYTLTGLLITLVVLTVSVIIATFISKTIEKQLVNIIGKIKTSAAVINNSTGNLTEISGNLADGSSGQASAIEETSAAMNETSSMISSNAENTRTAAQIAEQAKQAITEAGTHMEELMRGMSDLKESSDKVNKIVKTIDDIAFQTNLLAVNATIEAARAGGEAGRSFSVVAEEVRDLAKKSAHNSAETAGIIEHNITLTDTSRESADKVLVLAQKNAEQITELGRLASEINAASEEQATGIKQITAAVSQMEKQTQQNAAMAEETTASSQNLQNESASLDDVVHELAAFVGKISI
ncbi:MAG: methyl-accepting chemotaxis protein [Oscillospiraceae bacterium]|nr:methyl-accepting chemotaxis protein [Oscillospiraceae bacterium]